MLRRGLNFKEVQGTYISRQVSSTSSAAVGLGSRGGWRGRYKSRETQGEETARMGRSGTDKSGYEANGGVGMGRRRHHSLTPQMRRPWGPIMPGTHWRGGEGRVWWGQADGARQQPARETQEQRTAVKPSEQKREGGSPGGVGEGVALAAPRARRTR